MCVYLCVHVCVCVCPLVCPLGTYRVSSSVQCILVSSLNPMLYVSMQVEDQTGTSNTLRWRSKVFRIVQLYRLILAKSLNNILFL